MTALLIGAACAGLYALGFSGGFAACAIVSRHHKTAEPKPRWYVDQHADLGADAIFARVVERTAEPRRSAWARVAFSYRIPCNAPDFEEQLSTAIAAAQERADVLNAHEALL